MEKQTTKHKTSASTEQPVGSKGKAPEEQAPETGQDLPEQAGAEPQAEQDASVDELMELLKQKQESLESLNKKVAELKDADLRRLAEFDNFRKRTQKEKEETYQSAAADCVLEFLPVLDNLERAVEASGAEQDTLRSGVEMTLNQFREALSKLGVREIEAQGKEFDPNSHNAVQTVEDQELGENVICQVFQKGYVMGEKVLRHAMVVVANP